MDNDSLAEKPKVDLYVIHKGMENAPKDRPFLAWDGLAWVSLEYEKPGKGFYPLCDCEHKFAIESFTHWCELPGEPE